MPVLELGSGLCPLFFILREQVFCKPVQQMLIDEIKLLITPVLDEQDIELVDTQYRREGSGWVLRLIIDKGGGVTLDDCSEVSREISHLLDVEDLIDHAYRLEVSSPGLDRPLHKEQDYVRFAGRKAKLKTKLPVNNMQAFTGTILKYENHTVFMKTGHEVIEIPFDIIEKARLEVEL